MPEVASLDPQQAARHAPPSFGAGGLLDEAPALSRADWIPEGQFDQLDELREEHVRLHAAATEAAREIEAARARFEQEDATYAEAGRAQATGQGVELPELTPPEERAAELAPLDAKVKAITQVREQSAREAVATITARYDEWASELDARDGEVEARVEQARAALATAEAELGATVQLRAWLERTAGRHPMFRNLDGRHIAFAGLAGPAETKTEGGGTHE